MAWNVVIAVPDRKRGDAPPTAQHATREAKVVAANLGAELGIGKPRRYRYSSRTAFRKLRAEEYEEGGSHRPIHSAEPPDG